MALLEPKTDRLAPEANTASTDAAPTWVATGTPEPLRGDLVELLGAERVLTRTSDIVRYASDASPYRLFPQAIVMAHDAADVAKVLAYGRRTSTPVVFRAGGTSLNGQGQTDGILVDVRRHFRGVAVEGDGVRARVKPGTVLGHANRVLAPHGYKLGPDPASTDIACVGGVIANNSGGMRCGITYDSYETVRELTFVLASGTAIDSAAGAPRIASPRPSPSSPPACWRFATRSAPTRSWSSGSGASSRSRTPPATGCARSSTPTRPWRSSAGCSWAPRPPAAAGRSRAACRRRGTRTGGSRSCS